MADQTVNKFVIRSSIKELQSQRTFSSLEDLAQAVSEDLYAEGFALGPEEKAKIAELVNDEGYTGRFAFDDIVRRKVKNKKWVPLVSVLSAVCLFLLTTAVAAVVEHYVQRPLDSGRATPLSAVFQVPESMGEELLFKVQLTNMTDKPLRNVILFASAGGVARQISVDPIDSGQSRTVNGLLDLTKTSVSEVDFVAYVISGDFSLSSQPTRVARDSRYLAMLDSSEKARSSSNEVPGRTAAKTAAPVSEVPLAPKGHQIAVATTSPTLRTVPSSQLVSNDEIERLAGKDDPLSRQLLQAYAASGQERALQLLSN